MRKQLTINLRQKKIKQDSIPVKPAGLNTSSEIKPNFQYRPLGYSVIMNQNRCSARRLEVNEESVIDIDEKIQLLVEQNDRLSKSLKGKHSRDPSVTIAKTCFKTEYSPPKTSTTTTFRGIDFEKINLRMEKLEFIIDSQHREIDHLRSLGQVQTERAQTRQIDDIENLVKKNLLYSEMIAQQQQEIENYKHLTQLNQKLKCENQELCNNIKQYDLKLDEYNKSQVHTQLKTQEILNENQKLNKVVNEMKANNQHTYELGMKEKEDQIQLLLKEIETQASQLKIEGEENQYLRNMKIEEMKHLINSNNQTQQEITNTSIKMTEQKGRHRLKTENSFDSFTQTPQKYSVNNQEIRKRVILGDRQNEITKTLQKINSLSSIILKQTKNQNQSQQR